MRSLTRSQGVALLVGILSLLLTTYFGVLGMRSPTPSNQNSTIQKSSGNNSPNIAGNSGRVEIQLGQPPSKEPKQAPETPLVMQSSGNCSPNVVGVSNTFNCVPEQSTGNLKQRTLEFADFVLADPCRHGVQAVLNCPNVILVGPMPEDQKSKEYEKWLDSRSIWFRMCCLKKTIEIRDEFANLHIRNQDLDSQLAILETIDKAAAPSPIQPGIIVSIGYDLRDLANGLTK